MYGKFSFVVMLLTFQKCDIFLDTLKQCNAIFKTVSAADCLIPQALLGNLVCCLVNGTVVKLLS